MSGTSEGCPRAALDLITATAIDLKDHPADVLSRVQHGNERVAVTRYGKEVAVVVSIEDVQLLEQLEDLVDSADALVAIEKAEHEGAISLAALRGRLGR